MINQQISRPSDKACFHEQDKDKTALIIEGGGMRGIFSAGVLDSFLEASFDPFDMYYGISVGSLNLVSYLARQYKRNYDVALTSARSGQFISITKYLRGGHYVDLDWLANECCEIHPIDYSAALRFLAKSGKKFFIVTTDIKTGMPIHVTPTLDTISSDLRGSCALPLFYRTPVYVEENIQVMDGGVSDPIPVLEAYKQGAKNIVVVRSRHREYRKSKGFEHKLSAYYYRQHPSFSKALLNQPNIYNDSVDFILNPPEGVSISHIAPEEPLKTGRTTTNTDTLKQDYLLGREIGNKYIAQQLALSDGIKG